MIDVTGESDAWSLVLKKIVLEVAELLKVWLCDPDDLSAKRFRMEIVNQVLEELKKTQSKPDPRVT